VRWLERYFGQHLYVRFHPQQLWVRDVVSGREVKEPPWVALGAPPDKPLLATGDEAARMRGRSDVEVFNPFAHPRSPFSDFTVAEVLLRDFVRKVGKGGFFTPSPHMVVSLDGPEPEGGLTQIELRVMKELAIGAGASSVDIWVGPHLSDEQVRRRSFPTTGEVMH
jgi:rod shape-determining protein MreB